MVFSEVVGTLSFLQPQADDNIVDRLHYYYTSTFLLVTAVVISLKLFGGRPIECWLPAEYKGSWEDYTETFCWARSTFYVPFESEIPSTDAEKDHNMVSYYQWAPFFLIVCAFFFYAPCLMWRVMYDKSGIRLRDIVSFATDRSNIQPAIRQANVRGLAEHLGSIFKHRFRLGTEHPIHHHIFKFLNMRYFEAYLTLLYLGIKFLFFLNVVIQIYLMNKFLQTDDYDFYGFGVLRDLLNGRPWSDSGNFPRVTYCDMDIRILGNIQRHTVQCVLVINIFTEKVFILLWIWYTVLATCTLVSLVMWASGIMPLEQRKRFISRRLQLADVEFHTADFEQELTEFVRDYVKMDGVFVLNMLTIHAGLLICTEIVDQMWENYLEERQKAAGKSAGALEPGSPLAPLPHRRKVSVLLPLVSRGEDSHPHYIKHSITTPLSADAGESHFLHPPS